VLYIGKCLLERKSDMPLNTAASQWSARAWADSAAAVEKAAYNLATAEAAAATAVADARAEYATALEIERKWRADLARMMEGVATSYT
jgi:hypothetical protein